MSSFIQSFNIGANNVSMTAKYFKFIVAGAILFSALTILLSTTLFQEFFDLKMEPQVTSILEDLSTLINIFLMSFGVGVALTTLIAYRFASVYKKKIEDEHIKGSSILSEDDFTKYQSQNSIQGYEISPKVKLNKDDLTRMIGIFGSTGAGKSVLLRKLFKQITQDNQDAKVVFYDPKPEFFTEFYEPNRDLILSLEDKRSIHINLLKLIKSTRDLNRIVASIIPSATKAEEEGWVVMSRSILSGIFIYCIKKDIQTMQELRSLCILPFNKLLEKLSEVEGTEVAIQFLDIDEKQQTIYQGVFSSKISFIADYPCLDCPPTKNGHIDFEEFFTSKERRTLWILGDDSDEKERLKRTVSVAIELASNALFALGEDQERKVFFFIDEFSELKKMDSLQKLIVKGRSFGCSIFLLMQNPFQLQKTYGREDAETILSCLNTNIIFKSNGDKTLEILSNMIGKSKVKEVNSNQSYGLSLMRDGASHNESRKIENAVLGSEIQKLKRGEIYFGDIEGNWVKT
ncbi:MAG: type IV secretion system DNA-binding domain-containing protein, partial [Sulfurimonadaceae bacterium]|nr:type IV secretion system DNA-binding domain-containing protein [Sulfurimonadaceae bacterium]